jgi:hypothetical protein
MGHLSRLHKNNLSIPQENVCSNEDQNNENDKNSNSEGNDAFIVNNPGNASTASSDNSNISLASTVTIVNPESSSSSSLNSIPNIFHQISDFKAGGKKHIETTNWILSMIIKDNLPMYFVENIGFKQFLHKVLPLYSLPSRRTFTRMLDARYDVQSTIFREKLQSVDFYTLTADIWTEAHQTRSFLGITLITLKTLT